MDTILFIVLLVSAPIVGLGILWVVGRAAIVGSCRRNHAAVERINAFHGLLIEYVNSGGADNHAYFRLAAASTEVEEDLGLDNYPSALRMGHIMLQTAPVFPMAIDEMRRQLGDPILSQDAYQIASAAEGVLIRHLGRRVSVSRKLWERTRSIPSCIGRGWGVIVALPLTLLRAFGLLSPSRADRVQSTFVFRFLSMLLAAALAIATMAAPILSYLADREKIDAAAEDLAGDSKLTNVAAGQPQVRQAQTGGRTE